MRRAGDSVAPESTHPTPPGGTVRRRTACGLSRDDAWSWVSSRGWPWSPRDTPEEPSCAAMLRILWQRCRCGFSETARSSRRFQPQSAHLGHLSAPGRAGDSSRRVLHVGTERTGLAKTQRTEPQCPHGCPVWKLGRCLQPWAGCMGYRATATRGRAARRVGWALRPRARRRLRKW